MRNLQIDLLKGMAIISVILLHNTYFLKIMPYILGPFYIWQAVPVFIIIAGFNGFLFYSKRNIASLLQCYRLPLLIHRIERILMPYTAIWIIETIVLLFLLDRAFSPRGLLVSFLTGGEGPGSYFVPIIIQHILITPVLYWLAKRNALLMVVISFILTMSFEVFSTKCGLSAELYRLIYLRYLFAGALGVYLAMVDNRHNIFIIIGSFVSFLYILFVNYFGLHLPFIHPAWISQNAPSFMWPMMIVILGLDYLPRNVFRLPGMMLAKIGVASYHIFLVQMIYFNFSLYDKFSIYDPFHRLLNCLISSESFQFYIFDLFLSGGELLLAAYHLFVDLFMCVAIGFGFYLIGGWIGKTVFSR